MIKIGLCLIFVGLLWIVIWDNFLPIDLGWRLENAFREQEDVLFYKVVPAAATGVTGRLVGFGLIAAGCILGAVGYHKSSK